MLGWLRSLHDPVRFLRKLCEVVAALLPIVAVILAYKGRKEEAKLAAREFFEEVWRTIEDKGLLMLPQLGMKWLSNAKERLQGSVASLSFRWLGELYRFHLFLIVVSLICIAPFAVFSSWLRAIPLWIVGGILLVYPALAAYGVLRYHLALMGAMVGNVPAPSLEPSPTLGRLALLGFLVIPAFFLLSCNAMPVGPSFLVALILVVPASSALLASAQGSIAFLTEKEQRLASWLVIGLLALPCSWTLTAGVLALGKAVSGGAMVVQPGRMSAANYVCDLASVIAVGLLLGSASRAKARWYVLPAALIASAIVSAALACLSLVLGVGVSFRAAWDTLRLHTPDGSPAHIDGYFLAMNTAFIPIGLLLLLMAILWVGKYIALPVARFARSSRLDEDPYALTVVALTIVGALLGVAAIFIE